MKIRDYSKLYLPLELKRPEGYLLHSFSCRKEWIKEMKSKIENTNPSLTPTKPQSWSNVPLTFPYEKLKELGHCWCKSPVGQRQRSQFEKCVSTFFWFGFCLVFLGFFISTSWPTRENITSVQRFTHFPSFKIWIMPMIGHYLNLISLLWAEIFRVIVIFQTLVEIDHLKESKNYKIYFWLCHDIWNSSKTKTGLQPLSP